MGPDWSSLPSELLGLIADCLLATNDVDCYMDFRAVCTSWRSATVDPKGNPSDLRFRPRRWILVDEVFQTDERLMVNTTTGRVLRKDLPLLRKYDVITTTPSGFLVLADLVPPHVACVLNPLTGHMIRFKARLPFQLGISAAALSNGSPPALLLLSDRDSEQYTTTLDSEGFSIIEDVFYFHTVRVAAGGGFSFSGSGNLVIPTPFWLIRNFSNVLKQFGIDGSKLFSYHGSTGFADLPGTGHADHCFFVECAGQHLAVVMQRDRFKLFSMDTDDGDELEPVRNIRGRTIFVGYRRSLSVGAANLPSVAANCIYYVKSTDSSLDIYKYDLQTEKHDRVSEAIGSLNDSTLSLASPPFTIVQLLSSYTINARESQLAIQRRVQKELDDRAYSEYIETMIKRMTSLIETLGC